MKKICISEANYKLNDMQVGDRQKHLEVWPNYFTHQFNYSIH